MAYDFDTFCADCRRELAAEPGAAGRERVRQCLERLLTNEAFLTEHLGDGAPVGMRQIYRDPDADFCVLVYNTRSPRLSPPHDHGASWAAYGQVREHTEMVLYRRIDAGTGAGPARLEAVRSYRLAPGSAGLYDAGDVHSIDYPAGAQFVRVTGTDLDEIPRLRFDLEGDEAVTIESATVR